MFKNFIKVSFRNIVRNKLYSFINIAGLAIGMASTILILLWVNDELNYDNFHKNSENIYRVNKAYTIGTEKGYNPATPYLLAKGLKQQFAAVEQSTKCARQRVLLAVGTRQFSGNQALLVDPAFFNVFSFSFINGNAEAALSSPNSMVLTKSTAEKLFGSSDALGQMVRISNRQDFMVSAVVEDVPANSDFRYDLFLPIDFSSYSQYADNWDAHWLHTYVVLQKGTPVDKLETEFSSFFKAKLPEEKISLILQPLSKIHLYAIDGTMEGMKYVYFFSIIAFFILVIACINFMNLATARSSRRARETGLRKVMGAKRSQIAGQFFGESIFFTLLALIGAIMLVEVIRPYFNDLTGKQLVLEFTNIQVITGLAIVTVFTGLFSGSYPALFLSAFQPIRVLKGNGPATVRGKTGFRKIMVVIQFSLSIMLMIGTMIIYAQLDYVQNKDLGYQKDNIIYLSLNDDLLENYDAVKNELLKHSAIQYVSRSSELPTSIWSIMRGITWEGKETEGGAAFGYAAVGHDFFELMDMEIVQGRSFSKDHPADAENFIFNQKAIELMGFKDPVGIIISIDDETRGTIIGVAKDFHSLPLNYEIEPMIIVMGGNRNILIRVQAQDYSATIAHIEQTWNTFAPNFPFKYNFLNDEFNLIYRNEQRSGTLFKYFVFLAIFISTLGLFGLASFTAEQRTREMGIRKVLGASPGQMIFQIASEFARWVLISNLVAWPVAWYFMREWLQSFVYKTDMSLWIFIAAGSIALVVAMLTVSSQAIKTATANPVEALKYE